MRVRDIMVKNPIVAGPEASIRDIARLMAENSVGSVILVMDRKPVGIVTERDLVYRVLYTGKDPASLKAFEVSSKPVVSVSELTELEDALEVMRSRGVRRIVALDESDRVVGILTTNDLGYNLKSLSEELVMKYLIAMGRRKPQGEFE